MQHVSCSCRNPTLCKLSGSCLRSKHSWSVGSARIVEKIDGEGETGFGKEPYRTPYPL